jgi:hypothetical protein
MSTMLGEGDVFHCSNEDCSCEVTVTTAALVTGTGDQAELTCCGTVMVRKAG